MNSDLLNKRFKNDDYASNVDFVKEEMNSSIDSTSYNEEELIEQPSKRNLDESLNEDGKSSANYASDSNESLDLQSKGDMLEKVVNYLATGKNNTDDEAPNQSSDSVDAQNIEVSLSADMSHESITKINALNSNNNPAYNILAMNAIVQYIINNNHSNKVLQESYTGLHNWMQLMGKAAVQQRMSQDSDSSDDEEEDDADKHPMKLSSTGSIVGGQQHTTSDQVFACQLCPTKLPTRNLLQEHRLRYHSDVLKCKQCGKFFHLKGSLNRHLRKRCFPGGKKPSTENTDKESDKHKQEEPKVFTCEICSENFTARSLLKDHKMHIHSDVLKCKPCGKFFTQTGSLNRHQRIHRCNEKPSVVTDTDYRPSPTLVNNDAGSMSIPDISSKPVNLPPSTTSNKRRFKCSFCEKVLGSKHNLRIHERKHSGAKPFSCDTCGKSFAAKGTLVIHKRVHLEVKPFPCDMCDDDNRKSFTTRQHLQQHQYKLHRYRFNFSCESCQICFTEASDFIRHNARHENESQMKIPDLRRSGLFEKQ